MSRRSLGGVDNPFRDVLADFLAVGVAVRRIILRDAFVWPADQDERFEKTFAGNLYEYGEGWVQLLDFLLFQFLLHLVHDALEAIHFFRQAVTVFFFGGKFFLELFAVPSRSHDRVEKPSIGAIFLAIGLKRRRIDDDVGLVFVSVLDFVGRFDFWTAQEFVFVFGPLA